MVCTCVCVWGGGVHNCKILLELRDLNELFLQYYLFYLLPVYLVK